MPSVEPSSTYRISKGRPNAASVEAARPQIVEAVGATQGYAGVTGEHSFDEYGDTTNTMMTAYEIKNNKWESKFSEAYKPR